MISLQESWIKRIIESNLILIIGVRPYPEDMHIWKSIIEAKGKMGYIGTEGGFEDLKELELVNEPDHVSKTFTNSINSIQTWLGL